MDEVIAAAVAGTGPRNVIFELPVRHGKSERCDWWTPAWFLDEHPDRQVLLASREASFAGKWGRTVRDTIELHNREIRTVLRPDVKARESWATTAGGGMETRGVGGAFEGYGAGLAILDDPIKSRAEARSRTYRESLWEWFDETFRNRLDPDGVLILLMARWHPQDIVGRLKKNIETGEEDPADWRVVTMRAVAEPGDELDPLGRLPGEPLWPERWPAERLAKQKKRPRSWAARWQMRPYEAAGSMFDRLWFRIVPAAPADAERVRRWDLAATDEGEGDDPDYTAGVKLARRDGQVWIEHVDRFRASPARTRALIRQRAELDGYPVKIGIAQDPGQAGKDQIDSYRRSVLPEYQVEGRTETGSKATRAEPLASAVETGEVLLVEGEWNEDFIEEADEFPNGDYDDQIDAAGGGYQMLVEGDQGPGSEWELW